MSKHPKLSSRRALLRGPKIRKPSRRAATRRLGIEGLEDRRMLASVDWTHAEVADEAAAFFDDSYVHDLYITFDNNDWFGVLEDSHLNDPEDPYFAADFTADGVTIENVGVRFKGNSSFNIGSDKKSIKIDFDEFDEGNDDLTFFGLTKLNLNNNYNDPTQIREKLFLDYTSNFVEGVGRAVHTNVYVNGELLGLYTAIEQIDKTFVQSRFGSDEDGNLYKGSASDELDDNPQADFGSDLTYLGTDPVAYEGFYQLKTNETAYDYSGLVEFIDVLNNTPAADLSEAIEPLLDVDDTLAVLAANNLFANLDSYNGAAHNYYLYERDDTGQFTHIMWDANESFGTFGLFTDRNQDMAQLHPFWTPTGTEERPLMESLWEVDEYQMDYLRDIAEMLNGGFDAVSATTRINELADLIRDDVAADPNKQYTTADFETNLDNDVVGGRPILGLTSFISERADYLNSLLDNNAFTTDLALNELMASQSAVGLTSTADEFGDFDPWVEIYNSGFGAVEVTGLYLTDDPSDLAKWSVPSSSLEAGDFLTLWIDGETSQGSNHANFALDADGGTLQLSDGVTVIDTISYGALNIDTTFARMPDGEGEWSVTNRPTFAAENLANFQPPVLYINEFMADNDTTIEDPDDATSFEDWIELYNPGNEAIDLGGMFLTDDLTDPTAWQFTSGTTIAAGGYLVIWADDDTDQGSTHTSFKLSADGEEIGLYYTDGTTLIDSVVFEAQQTDVATGRFPDGSDNFVVMSPTTPGAANLNSVSPNDVPIAKAGGPYSGLVGDTIILNAANSVDNDGTIVAYEWDFDDDGEYDDASGVTASFSATTAGAFEIGLRVTDNDGVAALDSAIVAVSIASTAPFEILVNEFMADNDTVIEDPDAAGEFNDWIELYNPGTQSVDLGGMYLTDDLTDPTQWQFTSGTTIAAGGYLIVWADGDIEQGLNHASFKLASGGEAIGLFHTDGTTLIDSIEYDEQMTDVSYGRFPNGGEEFSAMSATPGSANVFGNQPPTVASSVQDQVVSANDLLQFSVPADTFADSDTGQIMTYSATLGDGTVLPDWMDYDSASNTFVFSPLVADSGQYDIRVTATDSGIPSESTFDVFQIDVQDYAFSNHNLVNELDVDRSGQVTPLDALLVINWLNSQTTSVAPSEPPTIDGQPYFLDVTADNLIAPLDALRVINELNEPSASRSLSFAVQGELDEEDHEESLELSPDVLPNDLPNDSAIAELFGG